MNTAFNNNRKRLPSDALPHWRSRVWSEQSSELEDGVGQLSPRSPGYMESQRSPNSFGDLSSKGWAGRALGEQQADTQLEQTIATDAVSNIAIEQKSDCERTSCLQEFCCTG
jgi:hypothetical protein